MLKLSFIKTPFFLCTPATHVLDEVSTVCCTLITTLKIVNISRRPLPMLAMASFVNLKTLYISPHNINDDLVECFGKNFLNKLSKNILKQ